MIALLAKVPAKFWIAGGVVLAALALWGAYNWQKARADRAEARLAPAIASVEALDRVATETAQIRSESAEKEKAVDQIEGSDTRLPDNFGRDLERVRRGKSD